MDFIELDSTCCKRQRMRIVYDKTKRLVNMISSFSSFLQAQLEILQSEIAQAAKKTGIASAAKLATIAPKKELVSLLNHFLHHLRMLYISLSLCTSTTIEENFVSLLYMM